MKILRYLLLGIPAGILMIVGYLLGMCWPAAGYLTLLGMAMLGIKGGIE